MSRLKADVFLSINHNSGSLRMNTMFAHSIKEPLEMFENLKILFQVLEALIKSEPIDNPNFPLPMI